MTASKRSHRRGRISNKGNRRSDVSQELDRGTRRSNRLGEVLEEEVERGGGEVERPVGGGLGVGAIRVGRPTDSLA